MLHVLIPLGDDFTFKNASDSFGRWERKVFEFETKFESKGFDADFQYSNVSLFFDKIGEDGSKISTYKGDFMPFIEPKGGWTDYWSGYYAT